MASILKVEFLAPGLLISGHPNLGCNFHKVNIFNLLWLCTDYNRYFVLFGQVRSKTIFFLIYIIYLQSLICIERHRIFLTCDSHSIRREVSMEFQERRQFCTFGRLKNSKFSLFRGKPHPRTYLEFITNCCLITAVFFPFPRCRAWKFNLKRQLWHHFRKNVLLLQKNSSQR